MGFPLNNAGKSVPVYEASVQSDYFTYKQTLIKMQLCSPRLFFSKQHPMPNFDVPSIPPKCRLRANETFISHVGKHGATRFGR